MMLLSEALSLRLAEIMGERHLTAYRLSMMTGVNQTTIADILKRRNKSVNLRIVTELCQGLEMELEEFFCSPYFKHKISSFKSKAKSCTLKTRYNSFFVFALHRIHCATVSRGVRSQRPDAYTTDK